MVENTNFKSMELSWGRDFHVVLHGLSTRGEEESNESYQSNALEKK